jgi:RND superfamily putative drug exporter
MRMHLAQRSARWSATHPWRAIGLWLLLVATAAAVAAVVPTRSVTDSDYWKGESGRAARWVAEAGLDEPDAEQVLVTADRGSLDHADARQAGAALADGARAIDGVAKVEGPVWSPDRSALLVSVRLARDQAGTSATATELTELATAVGSAHLGLEIRHAGDLTLDDAIDEQVADDLSSAETTSLPVTLLLMLLAFGALVAAGIPVLLAVSSVVATTGIMAVVSHVVPAEPTVGSMIVLIGMAVGVDYSLFYLKREREERARGLPTTDAVLVAAATSGHSILVSGGAVVVSMAGLYLVGDVTFSSLATGAILVVAVAVLGSVTVLPALLSRLGRWADRPRVPLLWRLTRRIGRGGVSGRLLGPVTRRPVAALVVSGTVVAALAAPALGMRLQGSSLETLPASIPEVQTIRDVADAFPSQGSELAVVVKGDPVRRTETETALHALSADAVASGFAAGDGQPVRTSADGTVSVLTMSLPYAPSDPAAAEALDRVRDDLAPAHLAGLRWAVGGEVADSVDQSRHLGGAIPLVVGAVLLLTMLIIGLTFRSGVLAVVTTVLNLASVGLAFGVLTLVFQDGWFEDALGFSSPGFVIDWLPLFVFVVLVGLSMDYHVFVLSRVQENLRIGMPHRLAVEWGVRDTAGVVTSAAAVMVSVFAIFATLSMLEMKTLGVGLSVAILADATLIRVVMLPAILVLLGRRAWPASPSTRRGELVGPEPEYAA